MRIAITDANIFIDLDYLGAQDKLFVLDLEIHTTQEVIDELDDHQAEYLLKYEADNLLVIHCMDQDEIQDSGNLKLPKGLSPTDRSVFLYAQKIEAMVLTADMALRKALKQANHEVHGIIWLFDTWVERKILGHHEAAELLERLVEFNTWLPMKECVDRITAWKK